MDKPEEVVLDIQNVTQDVNVQDWGKIPEDKLFAMIESREQTPLEDGRVKITIILDPKKGAI